MAIVQSINSVYQFEAAFKEAGRSNQFSWEGLKSLFDYLNNFSDDVGENVELDVISLCCDYSEDDYRDIAENYSIDLSEAEGDEDEEKDIVIKYLENHTHYLGAGSGNSLVYTVF